MESILMPNNAIAAGFENVSIALKSGTRHSGQLTHEDREQVTLDSAEEGRVTILKSEIASRTRGLSAMPEGYGELLSGPDLRDVIEYLSTLMRPAE